MWREAAHQRQGEQEGFQKDSEHVSTVSFDLAEATVTPEEFAYQNPCNSLQT
jgi:hypothetical protein